MRLDVITGTLQEYEAALAHPKECADIRTYYFSKLEEAGAAKTERLDFQSASPGEKASDNFALYGEIERAILDYLKEHDYPKEVRIVCDDEDVAKEYRVVYNFWFAETKAARLNDGTWD